MNKRILSLILVILLFPCSSFAQEINFQKVNASDYIPLGGALMEKGEEIPVESQDGISFFTMSTLEEHIVDTVTESETLPAVFDNLGQFYITKDAFADIYFDIVLKNPQLFLETAYSSMKYDEETMFVQSIVPRYVVESKEATEAAMEQLNTGLEEYINEAKSYTSDLEKLLVIHDKMIADCSYDVRALDKNTAQLVPSSARHAIGVFREKTAVCQGYSQALYMIADKLGIEMDFCYSEEKNHMWNYVNLDGKWYHIDLTNNDPPEKDENGNIVAREDTRAFHSYFMVSDAGLISTIHGEDGRSLSGNIYTCSDNQYETDHLFNVSIPFTAKRETDGCFHISVQVADAETEVDEIAEIKCKALYTGAVVTQLCRLENNLYYLMCPTKDLTNIMLFYRYDNTNETRTMPIAEVLADSDGYARIARNLPDIPMSFTVFLWESDTLTPYAQKAAWSQ